MELDERKKAILQAIIDDYIVTGVPIGSQTFCLKYMKGLSPATIRNEMAGLEQMGYLAHPHTSAARVPLEKAYRLYVDRMMRISPLKKSEVDLICSYFAQKMDEVEQVISRTATVLSDTTNCISMVLAPQLKLVRIRAIQFVPVTEDKALVLIITDSGIIRDAFISIPSGIDAGYLQMISNMLTEKLHDLSTSEVDEAFMEMSNSIVEHTRFFHSVVDALREKIQPSEQRDVILGGTNNIFKYPEYYDIRKASDLLQALETKGILFKLLSKDSDMKFTITIGAENEYEQVRDCSVITATYSVSGRKLGSFGVIGPIRMNYGKVVSILGCIGSCLNEMLSGIGEPQRSSK